MAEDAVTAADGVEEEVDRPASPGGLADLQPKTKVEGTVTRLELYGAFVDIGVGTNAILHISKLGEKANRVSDVLNVGDEVTVWIDRVDPERDQITVSMVEPVAVDWSDLKEGQVYTGTVTRLEKFGAFVDIGAEKEGLVHISELSHDFVKHPSEVVKVGDEIEVKVLGFNKRKRRIDLSRKALLETPGPTTEVTEEYEAEEEEDAEMPTAMEFALRKAMGDSLDAGKQGKSGPKSRSQGKDRRQQQEDILSRTLKMSQDAADE
jgi:small subunit ribosomal protein S1